MFVARRGAKVKTRVSRDSCVVLRASLQPRWPAVAAYTDHERRRAGWRRPKSGLRYAAALIEAATLSRISPISFSLMMSGGVSSIVSPAGRIMIPASKNA